MINSTVKKLLWAVVLFSVIAVPVTSYLTYLHFAPEQAEFCNFNEQFNCDVVNKSQWSVWDFGFVEIPVAIMGLMTYVLFLVVSLMLIRGVDFRKLLGFLSDKVVIWLMLLLSAIGSVFQIYLTYIEAFVLMTFCIFCVFSQILILLILITLVLAIFKQKKSGA